jgi:hypothetical protein
VLHLQGADIFSQASPTVAAAGVTTTAALITKKNAVEGVSSRAVTRAASTAAEIKTDYFHRIGCYVRLQKKGRGCASSSLSANVFKKTKARKRLLLLLLT